MRDREELERMIDYYVTGNPEHYDEQIQEQIQIQERITSFDIPKYEEEQKDDKGRNEKKGNWINDRNTEVGWRT